MAGREGSTPRSSFRTIAELMLLPIAALSIFFAWLSIRGVPVAEQLSTSAPSVSKQEAAAITPRVIPRSGTSLQQTRGSIALIIDDLGYGESVEKAMRIDPNVSFAILPNSNRARLVAERLHQKGFEILCHLPMEPMDGSVNPGDNAVLTSMSNAQIASTTRQSVAAIPYARGVNNHMGSRATADRRVMSTVIGALPDGFYFVDSRTGDRSIAADVARSMKVKTATRHVFLDSDRSEKAVREQIRLLAEMAEERGVAVGIGHPYEVTLRVLLEEAPALRARGIRFVRASEIVR
jgi:uncharacterized protein